MSDTSIMSSGDCLAELAKEPKSRTKIERVSSRQNEVIETNEALRVIERYRKPEFTFIEVVRADDVGVIK
jgi:hypothetical protein